MEQKKAPVTRKWAGLARKMRLCARYRLLAARAVDFGTSRRILASFDRMRSFALLHVAFLALFAYSLHGTGLCCDDFDIALSRADDPWFGYLLANPANILTHGLPFRWIGYERQWLYDLLKFGWVAAAYAMTCRFGSLFFPPARAALFAALFVFYPSHDATSFWFTTQYLLLTAAFYLYAFYLASRERLWSAAAMATLGSFVSYGSSPWAFGLGLAWLAQRQFRRAAVLLIPNLVYIGYYAALTLGLGLGNKRLPSEVDFASLARNLVLQIAGGVDAVFGPSLWLKLWYALGSLTLASALVGAAIIVLLAHSARVVLLARGARGAGERPRVPRPLWVAVAAVALGGFGMFALTGGYPQSAFGMGNRVTVYASFAAAVVLACATRHTWSSGMLAALLVFASLGLSDHWREWRGVQDATIAAVRGDADLASGRLGTDRLFVVGHDYSRLGAIAHIAFLAHPWIADPVFRIALGRGKAFSTVPLTSRFTVEPGALVNSGDGQRYPVAGEVLVYDSQARQLRRIDLEDMPRFIATLETPKRHWIQLVEIPWIRSLILRWMPQLGYLWR